MATGARWHAPAVLGVVILFGVALLVAVTVALYPTARQAPGAAPGHGGGPSPSPASTALLVDDQGCLVDFDRDLDQHMLCTHDLGPVWGYDRGPLTSPPGGLLCVSRSSVLGQVVPHPFPRFLDDGRRQVQEWVRVYPTEAVAAAAYAQMLASPACGAESGAVATRVDGMVTPLDARAAQGFEVSEGPVNSDVMVILVGSAVIQTSVTPLRDAPHDPDVVQLVAQVAVTRYLKAPPASASPATTTAPTIPSSP